MSDIFDHEIDAFESIMDTLEDSPVDIYVLACKSAEEDALFMDKFLEEECDSDMSASNNWGATLIPKFKG